MVTGRLAPAQIPNAMTAAPRAAAQEPGEAKPRRGFGLESRGVETLMGDKNVMWLVRISAG